MKKVYLIITICLLVLGCSENENESPNTNEPNTEKPNTKEPDVKTEDLFSFKTEYSEAKGTYDRKIIKIDVTNGQETNIADLGTGTPKSSDLIYLASNKEIISVTEENKLIIVNTETGDYSTVQLNTDGNVSYRNLTIDENENVYSFKTEYSETQGTYNREIIKINISSGQETNVANLGTGTPKSSDLIYLASSKEVISVTEENKLIIINTETGDHSTVQLNTDVNVSYRNLTIDEHENVYSFKTEYSETQGTYNREIIKINIFSGQETNVANLGTGTPKSSDLVYASLNKEIISVTEENTLIIINVDTGGYSIVQLDTDKNISYRNLSIK